ncbi:hypothetical protein ACS3SW_18605 [Roseobacteraceae bacterium S113]
MSYSCTETLALATKAARGAGCPPAQAARFGQALLHHLGQGRSERAVTDALAALPAGPLLTLALRPTPDTPLGQSYLEARSRADLPDRLEMSDALLDVLSRHAHETYVPATEASRLSGAGAGLTDND